MFIFRPHSATLDHNRSRPSRIADLRRDTFNTTTEREIKRIHRPEFPKPRAHCAGQGVGADGTFHPNRTWIPGPVTVAHCRLFGVPTQQKNTGHDPGDSMFMKRRLFARGLRPDRHPGKIPLFGWSKTGGRSSEFHNYFTIE